MREHKYRAWDKEYRHMYHTAWPFEHMVYVEMPSHDDQCNPLPINGNKFYNMNGKTFYFLMQKHVELMQYTGLKDSKGNEIFEGDLLIHRYPVGESIYKAVIDTLTYEVDGLDFTYHGVHFVFVSSVDDLVHYNTTGLETDYPSTSVLEVIGNIYEHPNLLKEVA